jgi:tRNA1(Val) A37 N6-methylase TrmN6
MNHSDRPHLIRRHFDETGGGVSNGEFGVVDETDNVAEDAAGDQAPADRVGEVSGAGVDDKNTGTPRSGIGGAGFGVATGARGRVWLTAQHAPRTQRAGRYVPDSVTHPAKMLPAVAAHAIATYTRPGELVLDPMCGIGTTLVEAVRADRAAVGVEYETRWARLAGSNLALASGAGHRAPGSVIRGDARQIARLLPADMRGKVALILTSPPYGPSTHGHVTRDTGQKIVKINHRYGSPLDRGNLANVGHHRLLVGFTRILAAAARFLRPGGHVVITVRPWREHAELIDLPAQIIACGEAAGLTPVGRCVALLGRVDEHGELIARGSFFQRDFIAKQRRLGLPMHLIAHEDLIVFAKLGLPGRSSELQRLQHAVDRSAAHWVPSGDGPTEPDRQSA